MVRANQHRSVRQIDIGAMAKLWPWSGQLSADFLVCGKERIESNLAEDDHHLDTVAEQRQLSYEVPTATLEFDSAWFIGWGRTAHCGGNVAFAKLEPVPAMIRVRLIGKSCGMERAVEPIAAAVAGEHPSRAIAAMRRGRQADDQHASI